MLLWTRQTLFITRSCRLTDKALEENRETIEQINEEHTVKESDTDSEAGEAITESSVDDDIRYTFVVPKGEIYREPEEAEEAEDPDEEYPEEPEPFIIEPEPPVYAQTGLSEDDGIEYTFVVPKGEVYREPNPQDTIAVSAEAVQAGDGSKQTATKTIIAQGIAGGSLDASGSDGTPAETIVVDKTKDGEAGKKTRYGLPADHPEMGELAQKQEERRRYKERKKNSFITRFYVITAIVMFTIGVLILSHSSLFTIDSIEVQGNSHYTAEEIINMSHAVPGRNIIYRANIKETVEYLEQNPYIRKAEVKRRLPSTLVIKVTERKERMAFKYDDDYLVMDEDGILLKKTRNVPKATLIQGIVVSKIKLGEKIGTEDDSRMEKAIDLVKMMIKSDLYFVKVDVSKDKKISAYIYDTLIVKTDYDTLMTNMENGRLHLVVSKLFDDGIERGTITFGQDGSASFMPMF